MSYGPMAFVAYVLYRVMVIPPLVYHFIKQQFIDDKE